MRHDSVWTGDIVVNGAVRVESNADETTDGPLEPEVIGGDNVNPGIRTISQIVFRAIRIDPADIERTQRMARNRNGCQAPGLCRRRRAGTGAWRGGGWRRHKRYCAEQRSRHSAGKVRKQLVVTCHEILPDEPSHRWPCRYHRSSGR